MESPKRRGVVSDHTFPWLRPQVLWRGIVVRDGAAGDLRPVRGNGDGDGATNTRANLDAATDDANSPAAHLPTGDAGARGAVLLANDGADDTNSAELHDDA